MNPQPFSGSLLIEALRGRPGDIAVVLPESGLKVTYGDLRRQSVAVAEGLAAAGVRRGDRVAMALPNGLPAIVCFLAAATAGTAAPLNPAFKEDEFRFYLEDAATRVLLLPVGGGEHARRAAAGKIPVIEVDITADGTVTLVGQPGRQPVDSATPDDIALVLHTSGSTGRPKRVPLTHANLTVSAANIAQTYALSPSDVSLCLMPLVHVHGLVASTLATFASGGTVVVPGKFNPLTFRRIAHEHQITWYSGAPALHQMVLSRGDRGSQSLKLNSLRFIRTCSAALSEPLFNELEATFGVPVLEAYGMTEAAHQMASNPLPPAARRSGSVGRATGIEISIIDELGRHLPPGGVGEVVIKGLSVTRGYEGDPATNASAFSDGWFRTGDQGMLDEAGYLTLVGRLKEMINRGGEKISPREIDDVLLAHPAVAEAVSFGVPHPTWGEVVAAAVVLRDAGAGEAVTESQLMAHCRQRLADYKRPTRIHITDTIPRTATSKIERRAVAAAYASLSS
jgi:acyl-CoA synthetase (AMP-forming)/AMP-acid ligase II